MWDVSIQAFPPFREPSVFSPGAGHAGEAAPNADCPLTRKLVTSPFKAGWLIFGCCRCWDGSQGSQGFHCSTLEHHIYQELCG